MSFWDALPVLLLVAIISVWFLRKPKVTNTRSDLASIPGPALVDKSGGHIADIAAAGSLHQYLLQLHQKYGEISSFWFLNHQVVSIAKPEYYKETVKLYNRPEELFALFKPLIGANSLQYLNGSAAIEKRKLLDKFFTTSATKRYFAVFLNVINNTINTWDKRLLRQSDSTIELSKEMFHLALHVIVQVLFGWDFDNEDEVQQLSEAYHICWGEMEKRLSSPDVTPERQKEFEKNRDLMFSVIQRNINKRRGLRAQQQAQQHNTTTEETEETNFLDVLMYGSGYSDEVVKADAITYLIGGFHTTANFLTWAMYFIASDPKIQERLHQEVKDITGDKELDFESVGRLEYMSMVLNETLRYIVLAPYAARFSENEEKIGDYVIPGNTKIMYALGAMAHNPHIWKNPETFDPSHFSPEESGKRSTFAFVPFGTGTRTCPAQRFSMIEGKAIIAKFLQKYKFSIDPNAKVEPEWGLVAQPKQEIMLTITRR